MGLRKPIIVPEGFSLTGDRVTIARWLKRAGDPVRRGEPIAEVETDKATVELEAAADGVLVEIVVADGDETPVAQPIAWLATDIRGTR